MRPIQTTHRLSVFAACCLLSAACRCGEASAQRSPREKIEVQYARIGFLPGPSGAAEDDVPSVRTSLYKSGAWVPVYISLNNIGRYDPDPKKDGPAVVIVEAPDCDDTTNTYTVPVPAFDEQEGDNPDGAVHECLHPLRHPLR